MNIIDEEEYDLVPLTPLPDKFIGLILEYTGNIFQSVEDLKQHIKKDIYSPEKTFQTGTEIYLCGLKQQFHSISCVGDILLVDNLKKKDHAENIKDEHYNEDIYHSLTTQMRYTYIDFP
jgi:hypothetical protein